MAPRPHWARLPPEIQYMILDEICNLHDYKIARCAAVSRQWQAIIERHNFSRIMLTPKRLRQLHYMVRRNRHHIRYLWFSCKLQRYDCAGCKSEHMTHEGSIISVEDNNTVMTSLRDLFIALSKFEPMGDLVLDISVHSPSDSEHWFKALTFGPDFGRLGHRQRLTEQQDQWLCQHYLPLFQIPAITSVFLRQQNRRRWSPNTIAFIFTYCHNVQEIFYEPWREWERGQQRWTDHDYKQLCDHLVILNFKLKRLTIFENSNEQYSRRCNNCDLIRQPCSIVSGRLAQVSLMLEHLSASSIADASQFFDARKSSFQWPNLASLALTSQLLTPDGDLGEIHAMLQAALAAAFAMPQLKTMEIWNGRKGFAGLFKYQFIEYRRPAVATWRGTWGLALLPELKESWEKLAYKQGGSGCMIVEELLHVDVKGHGDAVYYLQLTNPALRPTSLQQIRLEESYQEQLGLPSQETDTVSP
ncbi:hypothetical protein F4808DRAFT_474055 [Astrocystis sublimbata]|nr:hypothetical protein F4808DRAFT_476107 [Astrocystis sublimbata]KAI0196482.1 hypothetical protein F4808DRAFT_474055 [Astrocystis sublimbata]